MSGASSGSSVGGGAGGSAAGSAAAAAGAGVARERGVVGSTPAAAGVEGSSTPTGSHFGRQGSPPTRTLDDVMRAPGLLSDVRVVHSIPDDLDRKEVLDPKEDLWLSTSDGRYSSAIIPLRVGEAPDTETFYVHKSILIKTEYFQKALCGDFRESETQSINLPEENPAIFHFLIAYLYEGRYDPIRPIANVLVPELDKGKGKEADTSAGASSDSEESMASFASDISAQSRRRRERRRRREERHWERMRQKHPGHHRPSCGCPTCLSTSGPPCWLCAAPRVPPPPPQPLHPPVGGVVVLHRDDHPRIDRGVGVPGGRHRRRHVPPPHPHARGLIHPPPPGWMAPDANRVERIAGEDLRTWLMAYELNIDVYILANKFLLQGFKREIARVAIDMLETAGNDAAVPEVLRLCRKLYTGLAEGDPLLKMIFARVGFLQSILWRRNPDETGDFLVANPEVSTLVLRETISRREEELGGRALPSMERPWFPPVEGPVQSPYRGGPVPYNPYARGPPRW